ncbi:hypothetical protein E2C01_038879 [Portunus trituberculatus]|uniref:Uncharacterized protein n=1 Tax=Portunus trituberculatus TaxID=210409 RepID=A0A5B7FJ53_PORTR|nr:hypothetical protein [Portunus trituberculatus]
MYLLPQDFTIDLEFLARPLPDLPLLPSTQFIILEILPTTTSITTAFTFPFPYPAVAIAPPPGTVVPDKPHSAHLTRRGFVRGRGGIDVTVAVVMPPPHELQVMMGSAAHLAILDATCRRLPFKGPQPTSTYGGRPAIRTPGRRTENRIENSLHK